MPCPGSADDVNSLGIWYPLPGIGLVGCNVTGHRPSNRTLFLLGRALVQGVASLTDALLETGEPAAHPLRGARRDLLEVLRSRSSTRHQVRARNPLRQARGGSATRNRCTGPFRRGLPTGVRSRTPLVLGAGLLALLLSRSSRLGAQPVGRADGADRTGFRRRHRRTHCAATEPVRLDGVEDRQRLVGLVLRGRRNDRVLVSASRAVPLGQVGGGSVALPHLGLLGAAATAGVGRRQRILLPALPLRGAAARVPERVSGA